MARIDTPMRKDRCEQVISIFREGLQQLKPPSPQTLTEWADANRFLPNTQASSVPGPWRTSFTPYLKEIQNAISDRKQERIVVMSSARVGKTSIILHAIGYYIDFDPSPIMITLPTIEIGEAFSTEKLAPFLRDTKCLRGKVAEPRSRDGANTLKKKEFPGGFIVIAGANSAASLSSRDIKILAFDEVDRAPDDASGEGDPVKLAETRTTTFGEGRGRKIILTSTPTIKGQSRIEKAYENSTMEQWCLACPSCGEKQPLSWRQVNFETAQHACRECGCLHSKSEWLAGEGEWIARKPDEKTRGFHVNALVSPFVSWETLIDEFHIATQLAEHGDYQELKVFINTMLGETWEERGETVDESGLMARREEYYAEVPDGVCVLTIGVDTQDNRLCYEIKGWGAGKESWGIEYGELWGDPRVPGSVVWGQLDEVIRKTRKYANGRPVPVVCTCIDMGGHADDQVCTYAKARQGWNVWAVRGIGGQGKLFIHSTVKSKTASATVFNLGVDTGKDEIMSRLRVGQRGPGYCHFPRGSVQDYTGAYESVRGYDERYFAGLTAEKKVLKISKKGYRTYEWVNDRKQANEPFDVSNYASAALVISKVNLDRIAAQAPWLTEAPGQTGVPHQTVSGKAEAKIRRTPLNKQSGNDRHTMV